jgi:hypothetical protein
MAPIPAAETTDPIMRYAHLVEGKRDVVPKRSVSHASSPTDYHLNLDEVFAVWGVELDVYLMHVHG